MSSIVPQARANLISLPIFFFLGVADQSGYWNPSTVSSEIKEKIPQAQAL